MILQAIFLLIGFMIKFVFAILPNLPTVPEQVSNTVSQYIDLITSNLTFISFFLDVSYVKILLEILVVMIGFRYSYKFIMWIYRKLPISSD